MTDLLVELVPAVWAFFRRNVPVLGVLHADPEGPVSRSNFILLIDDPEADDEIYPSPYNLWDYRRLSRPSYHFWCRQLEQALLGHHQCLNVTTNRRRFEMQLDRDNVYVELPQYCRSPEAGP